MLRANTSAWALEHTLSELRDDQEVHCWGYSDLKYAPLERRGDKEAALAAARNNEELEHVCLELHSNKEVVLAAVRKKGGHWSMRCSCRRFGATRRWYSHTNH